MATVLGGTEGPAAGHPFRREGLLGRIWPFAAIAGLAEVSLVLPPGPMSTLDTILSIVLLAATAGAVFLPWDRLPAGLEVIVPLLYTASVLPLALSAGGSDAGVATVLLAPLVWTALFHRRWESACVVAAILAVLVAISLVPDEAPPTVIIRRVIFWGALSAVIVVATHGLRNRVRRSQEAGARLQGRLRELSILADRDRIAGSLQDTVVQRLFAAGLSLQSIALLARAPEVSRRVDEVVHNLDESIKLLRTSIFGLEQGFPEQGLRRRILDASNEMTPVLGLVPEMALDGPIDAAVPADLATQLVGVLRAVLAHSGTAAGATRVAVAVSAADGQVCLTVTDDGTKWSARLAGEGPGVGGLRDRARRFGGELSTSAEPGGEARLTWRVPLSRPAQPPAGTQMTGDATARSTSPAR